MKKLKHIIAASALLLIISISFGQDLPDRPAPPRLVVDYTGILAPSEVRALERKIVSFSDTTSNH